MEERAFVWLAGCGTGKALRALASGTLGHVGRALRAFASGTPGLDRGCCTPGKCPDGSAPLSLVYCPAFLDPAAGAAAELQAPVGRAGKRADELQQAERDCPATADEKRKGEPHPLPLSTYTAPGGLRQGPGHAAQSLAEARSCGNERFTK